MKKIYDRDKVLSCVRQCMYESILKDFISELFIICYNEGEILTSPLQETQLFQIVIKGTLDIYMIRDDGSRYSLSQGNENYILGDMELFYPTDGSMIYSEAFTDLICVAFPIEKNRKQLLENNQFLQLIGKSLSEKMLLITTLNAAPTTLKERVLSYMQYKCPNKTLRGLEQAAFHLHCSSRQLQRILNQYEAEGIVEKIGKGAYRFIT